MTPADEADALAAELALGLLDGEERAEALRRVLRDPDFAREVERWRAHFATLAMDVPPVAPPESVFARLEAALGGPAPAATPAPTNDNRRVRLWQGMAGLSSLVAAALIGVVLLRPAPTTVVAPATPVLVAAIAPEDKAAPIAAAYDAGKSQLHLAAAVLTDPAHSAELWIIAADGVPHSLGVLPPGHARTVLIDHQQAARFVPGSKLVVTREQPGGSPDGTPKGPAIAAGALISA
ncbi:anti-sigma factor [Sphingomonas sp. GlSt437]|uniref:anti-sigma factor n=1 Tax=Sphingomonas sp. GlSt437 TaxID=3389970 RepID=UPI003A8506F9